MVIKILIGVAAVILLFLLVVATRPSAFRIVRSLAMNAPPSAVFEQVNDFHKWAAWSPWEGIDPNMQRTYSGPAAGTGTFYKWSGNNKVGEGSMTMTESRPDQAIVIALAFLRPFKAKNVAEFTFRCRKGIRTLVTWSMTGNHKFMGKAFFLCLWTWTRWWGRILRRGWRR